MFDRLKIILKNNPLTNATVTFESVQAGEIKSDVDILERHESLRGLVYAPEPEPEDVMNKLEITMTKLRGKYKGFALKHLPHDLEPLVSVSHLERLRAVKTRVEQDNLQGLVELAIIRQLSNHIEEVMQSRACVSMLVDRLQPLLAAAGF